MLYTDAIFGEAIAHFKLRCFKKSLKCVEKAIESYSEKAKEKEINILLFVRAMCYKNLGMYDEASN